jgi:hypothetical protein
MIISRDIRRAAFNSGHFRINNDSPQAQLLKFWWPLNDLALPRDCVSGNGNATTITNNAAGAVRFSDQRGATRCWLFDAIDDRVNLPTIVYLSSTLPFTISCRAYLTAFIDSYPHILVLRTNVGTEAYKIFLSNNGSYLDIAVGSATTFARLDTGAITGGVTGKWLNIVVAYNGNGAGTAGNYSCFVNGASIALTGSSAFSDTSTSSFGGNASSTAWDWNGYLSDIRVYHRALSDGEIWDIYTNPFDLVQPVFMGPVLFVEEGAPDGHPAMRRISRSIHGVKGVMVS